jgi:hypothetical protein
MFREAGIGSGPSVRAGARAYQSGCAKQKNLRDVTASLNYAPGNTAAAVFPDQLRPRSGRRPPSPLRCVFTSGKRGEQLALRPGSKAGWQIVQTASGGIPPATLHV